MSEPIEDGGPAFPQPNHLVETDRGKIEARQWMLDSGMSLRDWFAGQALVGRVAKLEPGLYYTSDLATECYAIANAMLKERTQ